MYLKSKIIHIQSLSIFAILPRSITVWGHFNVILSSMKCHSQWEEHWGILLRTCPHGEIYQQNDAGIIRQWCFIGIHHATTDTGFKLCGSFEKPLFDYVMESNFSFLLCSPPKIKMIFIGCLLS